MLRAIDSVKDRLAGYFHWGDKQGLLQAINICLETTVDMDELEIWAIGEGEASKKKFADFKEKLHQREEVKEEP